MSKEYILTAQARTAAEQGKGASRRLRREGLVPAIVYGGTGRNPQSITLRHNELLRHLQDEAFYSQIISVSFGDASENVILRDLQRHPAKPVIMHVDLQRVTDDEEISVNVSLHFINADISMGVKTQGGAVSHIASEVKVSCLPKNIPAFIEVDLQELEKGQILHMSDIKLPEGVSLPELALGEDHNQAIVAIH